MRKINFYFATVALFFTGASQGQVWLGNVNSDWKNASNWAPGSFLTISANAAHWPVLDANVNVNSFVMEPGSRINLNGFRLEVETSGDNQLNIQGATIEGGGIVDIKGVGSRNFSGNTVNGNLVINTDGRAGFAEAVLAPNVYNGDITFNINGGEGLTTCAAFASAYHGNVVVNRTVPGYTVLFRSGFTAFDGDLSVSQSGGESFLLINPENLPLLPVEGKVVILFEDTRLGAQFVMQRFKNNKAGGSIKVTGPGNDFGGWYILRNNELMLDSLRLTDFTVCEAADNTINANLFIRPRNSNGHFELLDNTFFGNVNFTANASMFSFKERGNVYHSNVDFTVTGTGDVDFDFEDNIYYANLAIHVNSLGLNRVFWTKKYAAIHGDFTLTGAAHHRTLINPNRLDLPVIGGRFNIDFDGLGTPGVLGVYNMKNVSGGGRISITNVRLFYFENNEVVADSLVFYNFGGDQSFGEPQNIVDNIITGDIRIDGIIDHRGPVTIGRNTIRGNVKVIIPYRSLLWDLGNDYHGNVEYKFNDIPGGVFDPFVSIIGKETAPIYRGNVTIHNQNHNASLQIFDKGLAALEGDFTYIEEGGYGEIYINKDVHPCATIRGRIDIRCKPVSTLYTFFMARIKNAGGGALSIHNIRHLSLINDTLTVDSLVVRDIWSNGQAGGIMQSVITANVHLEDVFFSQGDIYLYGNTFNGNTVVKMRSGKNLVQGFYQPDVFNGNATFERLGSGQINLAYLAPVYFNGSLFLNTNGSLSFSDTVNFGGNDHADIEQFGTQSVIVPKLRINKPAGITLALWDTITVTSKVNFESGVINAIFNPLHFANGATHEGASATSHVIGKVLKSGGDAFTFPLGNYNTLNTVSMTAPANSNHLFSAEYFQRDPGLDGYNTNLFQQAATDPVQRVSRCEYWNVQRLAGSSNVGLIFSFNQRACPAALGSYITDPGKAKIVRWNGLMWQDLGNGGYSGSNAGTITTATLVDAFSAFTLASTDTEVNPLPLNLISFRAIKKDAAAQLVWETDNEVNVKQYEVQRAGPDLVFTTIAIVAANNSLSRNLYNTTDNSPLKGMNYYRLKSVDIDGSLSYSKTVSLNFSNNASFQVWPNPASKGNNVTLTLPPNTTNAHLQLFNNQGQLIKQWPKFNSGILPVNDLPAGIYILKIHSASQTQSLKLMIR